MKNGNCPMSSFFKLKSILVLLSINYATIILPFFENEKVGLASPTRTATRL